MSFNIIHNDHKFLSNIFEVVSNILEHCIIYFKKDGIYISGMDDSHVSLIEIYLNKDEFESYDFNSDTDIKISLISLDFYKILKTSDSDDNIIIKYKNNKDFITLSLQSDAISRNYNIKLIDIDENKFDIPDMDYSMILELSCKFYSKIFNSINITEAEYFSFIVNNNKLQIKSESMQSNLEMNFNKNESNYIRKKNRIKLNKSHKTEIEKTEFCYKLHYCNGEFNSTFLLNSIKKISKTTNLTSKIIIYLEENVPLKYEFLLNEKTNSIIRFYIAPKVDDYD